MMRQAEFDAQSLFRKKKLIDYLHQATVVGEYLMKFTLKEI